MSGGIPPQRPDQAVIPQTAAVAPGGAAGTFRGKLVIVFGTGFSGVFLYDPQPGAGNLIASIAAANGTDPYGNVYPQGIFSFAGGGEAGLANSSLFIEASGAVSPGSLTSPAAAELLINTGLQQAGDERGHVFIYSKDSSPSLAPLVQLGQDMTIIGSAPGGETAETWHTMPAMSASWTIGGFAKYRLTAQGDLQVAWQDLVPGSDADNTTIWAAASLPAAYRPAANHRVVAYTDILRQPSAGIFSGAALGINTDGSVVCFGIAAAATRVDLYATIPISA